MASIDFPYVSRLNGSNPDSETSHFREVVTLKIKYPPFLKVFWATVHQASNTLPEGLLYGLTRSFTKTYKSNLYII